MIHEEEGHRGDGTNGCVANLVRVKAEGGETRVKQASVAKEFLDEGVANFENVIIVDGGAHGGLVVPIRDCSDDSLHC